MSIPNVNGLRRNTVTINTAVLGTSQNTSLGDDSAVHNKLGNFLVEGSVDWRCANNAVADWKLSAEC